ncbi:MAG: EAL domain-containing protein, partial [Burkholderiales bacterium]|nr:EAL domain-containing protein [Burkholderiales bacterium]
MNASNLSAQQALLAAEQETARRLAVAQAQTKVVQAALQKQYPYGMSDAQWQAYLQKDPQGQQFNADWLAVQRSASNQLRLAADGAKDPSGAGAAIDSEAAKLKASGKGDATLNQVVDDAAQSVKGQSAAARATSERAFRMEIVSQTPGATDAQKSAALNDFNQALGHEIALQAAQLHLQNAQADMAALNKLPGGVRRAEYGDVSSELSQAQSEYAQVQAGHDDAGVDVSPAEQQQAAQAVAQGHSTELYSLGDKSDPLSVPGETAVISAQQMLQHYVANVNPNDPTLTPAQKQLAQSDPVAFAQVQMSGVQIDPSQIKNGWEKQLAQSNPLEYAIYKMTGVDATSVNPDDPSLSATDKTQLHNKDYLQYAMAHASQGAQAKIGLLLGAGQTVRFNRVQSQVNQLTQGTRTSANDAKALQILQTNMSQAPLPGEADALWQNIGAPRFSASYIQSQYAALIQSPGDNATPAQKNDATMNADKVGLWLQQVTKNAPPQFAALALQTLRQNFDGQWFQSNSGLPSPTRGEELYKGLSQAVQVADQQDPSHAEANQMAAWLLDAGNTTAKGKAGTLIYAIQGSAGSGMMMFQSVRDAMSGGYGTDLSDALNAQIYSAKSVPANNFTQAYQLGSQEAAGKQNSQYAQQSYQSFLQAAPATLQAYFNDIGQHYGTGSSQFGDTTQLDNFIAAGLNMAPDTIAMPTVAGANGQPAQAQSPLMTAQWLRQAGYAAPQSGGKPVSNEAWAQLIVGGQYALPLDAQAQLLTPQQLAKLLATGQYAHVAAPTDSQGKALSEQQIVQALSAGKYPIPAAGLVNFSAQATLDGRHAVPVDIYGKPLSEGELLHQISIGTYRGENLYAHNPKFADIVTPVAKQLQTVAGVSLPSQASAAGASGAPVLTVSLIPTFYASSDGGANPSSLFGVTDKGSHHTKLIDDRGWHYDNLSDYQHNNALGGGQLYVPTWLQTRNDAQPGGIELASYSKGPAGAMDIAYSQVDSHQTTGWQHVEHFLDDALGLVAVVAGTALLFTGVGTGVGVALLGATAVGMGWGAYRSFDDLANLGEHGQAINPFAGGQATQDWVAGTVSLLALGASGATLRGARLLMLAKTLPEAERAGMLADAMKWDTLASRINRPAMIGGTYQMATQGAALIHNWDQMSGYQKWSQLASLGANMTPFFVGKYIKSLHGDITQQQGLNQRALRQAQAQALVQAVAFPDLKAYWTNWLDDAIENGKFKLQYQPLHDSLSGEISHYEVLIRHTDLRPDQFIPALEAHGLSLPLAQWVIAEAVRAAAGHPDANLAINLSGPVLNDGTLPATVDALLSAYGVPASRISFEITETGDLPDMRVARDVLRRLRARGHEIAIDDFDQQRSLDYVSRLQAQAAGARLFDTLKIAREWVAALGDPAVREAVKFVVDDMHRMGIKVIGEGVETEEDSARLDALGVDIQQGWYWGRPGDLPEQAGLPDNMPPRPGKTADDGSGEDGQDGGDASGGRSLSAAYHLAPPAPLTEAQAWQLGLTQAGSPPVAALEQFPSLGTQSAMRALDPDALSAALVAKGVATDTAQAFVAQLAQTPEPVIGSVSWTSARDAQPSPAPASTDTSSASTVNDQPVTGEVPDGATAQAILAHPVYGPVARKFAQYLVTEDRLAPRWAQRAVYARSLGDKLRNALAASGQHAANPGAHADFDAFVADRLRRDAGTFLRNALMYLDKSARRQAKLDAQLSALPPGMLGSAAFHDAVQVARDEILGKRSSARDTPDAPDEGDPPQDRYTLSAQYHPAPPAPLTDPQAWQLGLTQTGNPAVATMEPYISQITHQAMRGIDPSTLYPELLRIGLSENTARAFVAQLQEEPSRAVVASAEMNVRPEDLDMSRAVPVISTAQKFILPIPPLADGEPLVYPAGTIDAGGALLEGQPIPDRQGNPLGETGVVFHNAKDQSLQAVPGDGSGVIIFNEVTEAQAAALSAAVTDLAGTPEALNHAQVVAVLDVATSLGLTDCYNSDIGFIRGNMTPVGDLGADCFGLYKRDDRDTCWAVRVVGRGTFRGPAASPQRFDSGAVIVRQGNEYRLVQSSEFGRTYCHSDATPIDVMALPVGLRGFSLDSFIDTAPPGQTEDAGAVPAGASADTSGAGSLELTYEKSASGNWLLLSSSRDPGVSVKVQIGATDNSPAEGAAVINVHEIKPGRTAPGAEGWLLMALLDHYGVLPSSGTLLVFPDIMEPSLLAAYAERGDPARTPLGVSLTGALPGYGLEISGFHFDDHGEQLSLVVLLRGRDETQTSPPGSGESPVGGSTVSAAYYPEAQQPPGGPTSESPAAGLANSGIGALEQFPSVGTRRAASGLNPDLLRAQLLDIGMTPGTAQEFVAQLSAPSPQHAVPRYWFADGRDAGDHASTPFNDSEHERFGLTYGYGRGLLGLFSASDPKVKLSVGINVDAEGYLLDPAADKFNIFMIDRGDLPPGAGSRMLLTLLQHFDIGLAPTGRATIEAIVDQSAIDAFEHQTDPAQTRLARSLARALSAHGLSAEFEFKGENKDGLSLEANWHQTVATDAPSATESANDAPQQGLYVSRPVDPASAQHILDLGQSALTGDINWVPPNKMHVTVVRSPNDLRDGEIFTPQTEPLTIVPPDDPSAVWQLLKLGNGIVLRFEAPALKARWEEARQQGAGWTYGDSYVAHVTVAYEIGQDFAPLPVTPFPITLGGERVEPFDAQWVPRQGLGANSDSQQAGIAQVWDPRADGVEAVKALFSYSYIPGQSELNVEAPPDTFRVRAHGTLESTLLDEQGKAVGPYQFVMQHNLSWKVGQIIFLAVDHAGAGGDRAYAQQLADTLNTEVIAPDGPLSIAQDLVETANGVRWLRFSPHLTALDVSVEIGDQGELTAADAAGNREVKPLEALIGRLLGCGTVKTVFELGNDKVAALADAEIGDVMI